MSLLSDARRWIREDCHRHPAATSSSQGWDLPFGVPVAVTGKRAAVLAPPGSPGLSSRWSPLRTVDSHPSQWSLEPLGGIPVCSPPASLQTSVASRSLSPQLPLWASPAGFDGGLPCFPNSWDLQDKLKPCGLDLGAYGMKLRCARNLTPFPAADTAGCHLPAVPAARSGCVTEFWPVE